MDQSASAAVNVDELLSGTFVRRVELHDVLGSTNDHAKQCARQPDCETPLLVVARRQTAGRGRGTHRWWSAEGGLTFSLLLGPDRLPPRRTPLVSLATAVAVARTLQPLAAPHPVGLHWPNDVMVAGRKVTGILIEILRSGHGVIGVGVNTNNHLGDSAPADVRRTAVTLLDLTGRRCDHTTVLVGILQRLERALDDLHTCPAAVAAAADSLCLQRGQTMAILSAGHRVEGVCTGIASDGALLLDTLQGPRTIHSGTGA